MRDWSNRLTMRCRELSVDALRRRLAGPGVILEVPPNSYQITAKSGDLAEELLEMYGDFALLETGAIPDFQIDLRRFPTWRPSGWKLLQILIDGSSEFDPSQRSHAYPLLESAMNWCDAYRTTHRLLLHAGVVERHGLAVILPGASGSGKSTLSTALAARGWRLLSDEMTMIDLDSGRVEPHPRPASLKNEAIDVIASFAPDFHVGRRYEGTIKGTVAFVRPPHQAVEACRQSARPVLVVAPSFQAGKPAALSAVPRAQAFADLVDQSMNYHVLLRRGFDAMAALVENCNHYRISYGDLDQAIEAISRLHHDRGRRLAVA